MRPSDYKITSVELQPAENGWVLYARVYPTEELSQANGPMEYTATSITRVAATDEQLMTELAYLVSNYGH